MHHDQVRLRGVLEILRRRYNTTERAAHDPVSFVHACTSDADRELVGLVAALLAYGRLAQILQSVHDALGRLGAEPARRLAEASDSAIGDACRGFVHRFADAADLAGLLRGARDAVRRHGSLNACFLSHDEGGPDVCAALAGFAGELAAGDHTHLLADPSRGSACKRWHLYLRWMVRRDQVDVGCWSGVSPARLVVPLDAHMWRICRGLGLTKRASPGLRAALEVTKAFGALCLGDPVRYDFALMHASVSGDADLAALLEHGPEA